MKVGLRDAFSCTYYTEDCSVYAAEEYESDAIDTGLNLNSGAFIKGPAQPIMAGAIQWQILSELARDTRHDLALSNTPP